MKTTSTLFAILCSLIVACSPRYDDQITSTFEATVQSVGGDCKLPLLDFGPRTAEVEKVVGLTTGNRLYYAVNLEPAYSKAGISLKVTIRKATVSEERACTTMGPTYQSVVVTSAVTE